MSKIVEQHNDHLKEVYGDSIFEDKNFFMNYGWCSDDYSITTKIYKEKRNEFLTTYQIGRKFVYDSGKL